MDTVINCPYPMSDVIVVDGEASLTIHPLHNASSIWVQKSLKTPNSPGNVYWKYNGDDMLTGETGFIMPDPPSILYLHYNGNDQFYFHFWLDNNCRLMYQFFRPSLYE